MGFSAAAAAAVATAARAAAGVGVVVRAPRWLYNVNLRQRAQQ